MCFCLFTQFLVRRTSFSARYFLRNIRRADLVVPASSAVCHKKNYPLIYWRCSAPVSDNSCIVTAVSFPYFHVEVPFNEITARLQSSLCRASSQGNAYSPTVQAGLQSYRTNRPAVLPHKQACSPTAQTGPQSYRTNRPAVPPHKQARSPTSQTGPQSHRTNRPAVLPHKQARSPTAQTGPQSHRTNSPAVPPHKHLRTKCVTHFPAFLCLKLN